MSSLVELRNVVKKYGKNLILDGINLNIEKGDFIAITGMNGCGKSTLVNIISKVIDPTSGETIINVDKNEIGMQIQEAKFDDQMLVKDYINLYKNLYKLTPKEYEKTLKLLRLDKLVDYKIKALSGGQKQKLNIMISLIHNPKLIIFDELTSGLDSFSRYEIREILHELNKEGVTMIIVSHYMDEVEYLCNRLIVIDQKKIILDEYIEKILKTRNLNRLEELFKDLSEKGELTYE